MSMRYRCTSCYTTLNGDDKRILTNLSQNLQAQFPAYLTHRSGVSKDLCDQLRWSVQNSGGPKRFAALLRELHMLMHNRLEKLYLHAVETKKRLTDHFGSVTYPPFSAFHNKLGYDGHVPTATYLRQVYTSLLDNMRPLLDGKVLKGDHSFKIIKHLATLEGGTPAFSAL